MSTIPKKQGDVAASPSQHSKSQAPKGSTSASQRRTHYGHFLAHLQEHGSATSAELADQFNALQPPGTIRALRRSGHDIRTVWTLAPDEDGILHRCARYYYHGQKRLN
jgi:hypothetical protein